MRLYRGARGVASKRSKQMHSGRRRSGAGEGRRTAMTRWRSLRRATDISDELPRMPLTSMIRSPGFTARSGCVWIQFLAFRALVLSMCACVGSPRCLQRVRRELCPSRNNSWASVCRNGKASSFVYRMWCSIWLNQLCCWHLACYFVCLTLK